MSSILIVTGGGRGIGAQTSIKAAAAGWEARPGPEAFDFRGTFVRLWTLTR